MAAKKSKLNSKQREITKIKAEINEIENEKQRKSVKPKTSFSDQ